MMVVRSVGEYVARQKALTGEAPDFTRPGALLALLFGAYEEMMPSLYEIYWLHPGFPEFLASPQR